ncbi:hypothetical protein [Deinococcus radiophilus]|uniref:hypothetical protein n=1 Tax=Deinococcus radiophilus TaxID=32062 RepID=UPI003616DE96
MTFGQHGGHHTGAHARAACPAAQRFLSGIFGQPLGGLALFGRQAALTLPGGKDA